MVYIIQSKLIQIVKNEIYTIAMVACVYTDTSLSAFNYYIILYIIQNSKGRIPKCMEHVVHCFKLTTCFDLKWAFFSLHIYNRECTVYVGHDIYTYVRSLIHIIIHTHHIYMHINCIP